MTDTLTHHELFAEWVDDKQGRAIMLTQPADNFDEPSTVLVHPWQLRAVCERFEIIASDPQAAKTIAALKRRLLVLAERIDHLAYYLANHSDHKHADLSFELTYATATADIAAEFVAEFDDLQVVTDQCKQSSERTTAHQNATDPSKQKTGADTRQLTIEA